MNDFGLEARPPLWALQAGLPAPPLGETFCEYVTRLGLDAEELLVDLTEQTIPLANYRLATHLQRSMPEAFDRHVRMFSKRHLAPDRLDEVRGTAASLWGDNFRRPVPVA